MPLATSAAVANITKNSRSNEPRDIKYITTSEDLSFPLFSCGKGKGGAFNSRSYDVFNFKHDFYSPFLFWLNPFLCVCSIPNLSALSLSLPLPYWIPFLSSLFLFCCWSFFFLFGWSLENRGKTFKFYHADFFAVRMKRETGRFFGQRLLSFCFSLPWHMFRANQLLKGLSTRPSSSRWGLSIQCII